MVLGDSPGIGGRPRQGFVLQPVAGGEGREGFVVAAARLKGFAQGEEQGSAGVQGDAWVGGGGAQRLQLRLGDRGCAQDREPGQGAQAMGGIGGQPAVALDRLIRPPKHGLGDGQAEAGLGGVRAQRQRPGEGVGGLGPEAEALGDVA